MDIYTREIESNFNHNNIIAYRKYCNGMQYAWSFEAAKGYVMYDTKANDFIPIEDEYGNIIEEPCIFYCLSIFCPLNYDLDNFSWVAVPRESVDENYIY